MDKPLAPLLIVDDEPSVLSALRRELRETAPVFTAQNPKEALRILKHNTIGVVVSDYKMPEKDGVSFLSELGDLPYEPVKILMTAYSDPDIAVSAVNRAGIFYFLKKPWNSAELTVLMERALEAFHDRNELKSCRRRLEEIERIKNSITNILNHELKTPLTTISGYTEILGRQVSDVELKNVISSLQGSVTKLEGFIDDTLYIARIEAGQVELKTERVDLRALLEKVLPVFEIEGDLGVDADRKLLTEAFYRVSRYLSLQGGTLTAEAVRSGSYLTLKLSMTGRNGRPGGNGQLALFQRLESHSDIMHYGSDANLDMIFASAAFRTMGTGFSFTELSGELRIEILFCLP